MKLTKTDLNNIERELCKRSLHEFVKRAWRTIEPGNPYIDGWHVGVICEHLAAVTNGDINRLLINIPPGTMKSTLVSVFWPAWEWGARGKPHHRFIGASHEMGLATRDAMRMRRLVTSEWYQRLWPLEFSGDQNQKTYFENKQTGFRQACPVSSMTGRRGDRVIWDDPHSAESALSDAARTTDLRIFRETLPTRLNVPTESAIIIVMQRLHEQDVSGEILANDLGYVHLCLAMEYDSASVKANEIGFTDPRKEDGDLLFPERFTREVVDRDKKILGPWAVAGQFQQRPAPLGGGIFKDEWWKFYDAMPSCEYRVIYADTAMKTAEQNDYSVFQCWAKAGGNIYLVDQIRGKWEAPELMVQARAFWAKHRATGSGTLRAMRIEDKASGTGLIQSLKREGIPVEAIQRQRDKVTRAMDAAPSIHAGLVYIPKQAPFISDFMHEFSSFPNGLHDDQIDPLLDAVADLLLTDAPVLFTGIGSAM